ncbi:MAG: hypothetical protein HY392_03405 [Candidatus Diapherotrites archaeon]|nr:hypothetical protein [Candidatus Diapherotrites archaeon]
MKAEKKRQGDVAVMQEWLLGTMNLAAIEEHLAFTIAKTKKPAYDSFLVAIRKLRSKHLGKIVSNTEGENWCVAKHLLLASKHFEETAVKLAEKPAQKKQALELWTDSQELLEAFWVLQALSGKGMKNKMKKKVK